MKTDEMIRCLNAVSNYMRKLDDSPRCASDLNVIAAYIKKLPHFLSAANAGYTAEAWAWWEEDRKEFKFVYPSETIVRMCSPDGFQRKELDGEGKVMKVKITAA